MTDLPCWPYSLSSHRWRCEPTGNEVDLCIVAVAMGVTQSARTLGVKIIETEIKLESPRNLTSFAVKTHQEKELYQYISAPDANGWR